MHHSVLNKKHFLLDIETSGLNKNVDYVVCIGVGFVNQENKITNHQWMLQFAEEEKQILECFLTFIQDFTHVYTYSGKHFDWPFLLARCAFHGLDVSSLHQLHLIDMKKSLQHFDSTRLHLENKFGLIRQTTTSGKELSKVYKVYQSCGELIYKELILNHNKDELTTLYHFYELYQVLYHLKYHRLAQLTRSSSHIHFSFEVPFIFNSSFEGDCSNINVSWQAQTQVVAIKVAFFSMRLKKYLTPYKDYYYIPSQNQLLHRTLASFIAAPDKRKASKEECTIHKEDDYTPLFTTYKLNNSVWYDLQHNAYLNVQDFSSAVLADQLFYLLFSSTKKTS